MHPISEMKDLYPEDGDSENLRNFGSHVPKVHGVTCHKVIFRFTDVRTPKLTELIMTRYIPRMAFHRPLWVTRLLYNVYI